LEGFFFAKTVDKLLIEYIIIIEGLHRCVSHRSKVIDLLIYILKFVYIKYTKPGLCSGFFMKIV